MPVPYGPFKGEVLNKEQFDKMLDEYYALRGYDSDGIPKEETFMKFGLSNELEIFKKRLLKGYASKNKLGRESKKEEGATESDLTIQGEISHG